MEKPRLLFYEDPYKREATAKVIAIEDNVVWLDQTIFFAESGGQESDRGTINGISLVDVQPDDFGHILESPPNFGVGDTVKLVLDWDRRYKLMRLHSAAHLVSIAVEEIIGKLELIGSHVSPEKSRLDYAFDGRVSDYFDDITKFVNSLVDADKEIRVIRDPENPELRIWILDNWRIYCSGLHVRRTSEVGHVKLRRKNLGRGKERIEIYLVPQ